MKRRNLPTYPTFTESTEPLVFTDRTMLNFNFYLKYYLENYSRIQFDSTVKKLDLSHHLTDPVLRKKGIKLLANVLQDNTIEELDLSNNRLQDEEIEILTRAMHNNTKLKSLFLSCNLIGSRGAKALAKTQIEVLDLSFNQVGDQGAKELAQGDFKSLSLCANQITNKGAREFAHYNPMTKLEALDLSINPIGNEGAKALAATLNQNLTELGLSTTHVKDKGAKDLSRLNDKIKTLNLSGNKITNQGIMFFNHHLTLKKLGLNRLMGGPIDTSTVKALVSQNTFGDVGLDDNNFKNIEKVKNIYSFYSNYFTLNNNELNKPHTARASKDLYAAIDINTAFLDINSFKT